MNPIVIAIPIFFILILLETVVLWKKKALKGLSVQDSMANIGCGILDQLMGIGLKLIGFVAYYWVFQYFSIWQIENALWSGVVCFVLADLCYYWAHRKSHEVNLFWLGHSVHHQSEYYNLSVALRQGAFQTLFTFPFYLPLAVLGFQPDLFFICAALGTLYQFWIHTEIIGKLGWFEMVFNSPSHHRVHHGKDEKYLDKNHAGVFIIWDKIFGTFQQEIEKPNYGITVPINTYNAFEAHFIPFRDFYQSLVLRKDISIFKRFFYSPAFVLKGLKPLRSKNYPASFNNLFSQLYNFQYFAFFLVVTYMVLSNDFLPLTLPQEVLAFLTLLLFLPFAFRLNRSKEWLLVFLVVYLLVALCLSGLWGGSFFWITYGLFVFQCLLAIFIYGMEKQSKKLL